MDVAHSILILGVMIYQSVKLHEHFQGRSCCLTCMQTPGLQSNTCSAFVQNDNKEQGFVQNNNNNNYNNQDCAPSVNTFAHNCLTTFNALFP